MVWLTTLLSPRKSPHAHVRFVSDYGRNVYIRGLLPVSIVATLLNDSVVQQMLQWDQRLFTLDPVTMSHVLQHTTTYEKPYPSRQLISRLIGVGMLSAEGQVHKRQKRIVAPAFSIQTMHTLVPLVFSKGTELKEKWLSIMKEAGVKPGEAHLINVCSWASRATFDVMGAAGAFHSLSPEIQG